MSLGTAYGGSTTSSGGGVDTTVETANSSGYMYLQGDATTEGSVRFNASSDIGAGVFEKLENGIWTANTLEMGVDSLFLGPRTGLASIGEYLSVENSNIPDARRLFPYTVFNGTTIDDLATIPYVTAHLTNVVSVPFDSDETTGTSYSWTFTGTVNAMLKNIYIKIGSVAPTDTVRFFVRDNDENGQIIFDESYPASAFAANSTVALQTTGFFHNKVGDTYYSTFESSQPFSILGSAALQLPYFEVDASFIRDDRLWQASPWEAGTYAVGDYVIEGRVPYICVVAGAQATDFATNSTSWKPINGYDFDDWVTNYGTRAILDENYDLIIDEATLEPVVLEGT
ncbi:gp72 [Alphaproteobacteria phage PhiJL001]|uniref:Gp72 n=1 Tax=Alphaproteobacteria phage PhiJL001 TaxID=2681607 RepID=Q5DN33_9CAUD|nr:gp72 [Alphaproteobacteria phage PhiJL001]AAT69468.1 gp72 [Alphaproteobacteria phage PhiJL001]